MLFLKPLPVYGQNDSHSQESRNEQSLDDLGKTLLGYTDPNNVGDIFKYLEKQNLSSVIRNDLQKLAGELLLTDRNLLQGINRVSTFFLYYQSLPNSQSLLNRFERNLIRQREIWEILSFLEHKKDSPLRDLAFNLIVRNPQKYNVEKYVNLFPIDREKIETIIEMHKELAESLNGFAKGKIEFLMDQEAKSDRGEEKFKKNREMRHFISFLLACPRDISDLWLPATRNYFEKLWREDPDVTALFKIIRDLPSSTVDHQRVALFLSALEEENFVENLSWAYSSLVLLQEEQDEEVIGRFILSLRLNEDEFSDLSPEGMKVFEDVFAAFVEKRRFEISELTFSDIQHRSFFDANKILKLGKNRYKQASLNEGMLEDLASLALRAGSNDPKVITFAMKNDALGTVDFLLQKKFNREKMLTYLGSLPSLRIADSKNAGEFHLKKISFLLAEKELGVKVSTCSPWNYIGHSFGWCAEQNLDHQILEFFRDLPKIDLEYGEKINLKILSRIKDFNSFFLKELKGILEDNHPLDDTESYSRLQDILDQMSFFDRPDKKEEIHDGLTYLQWYDPSVRAFKADPKKISLRIVHADSWEKGGKTLDQYLQDHGKAIGGISGGFWSDKPSNLATWAYRRFITSMSTIPASILKTPQGLANDSENYFPAIGWKDHGVEDFEVHAAYLKTKWFLKIGHLNLALKQTRMVPYSEKHVVLVNTDNESYFIFVDTNQIIKFEKMKYDDQNEFFASYAEANIFEAEIDDKSFLEKAKKENYASIEYKFYVPVNNLHDREDLSQNSVWKSMDYIMTGNIFLVQDGIANTHVSFTDSNSRKIYSSLVGEKTPRTVLCYLHNRQWLLAVFGHVDPTTFAQTLLDIGCLHAINLDGGPSSQLRVKGREGISWETRAVSDVLLLFPK